MINRFYFLLISLSLIAHANQEIFDFGVKGSQYDILEVNGNTLINDALHEFNTTAVTNYLIYEVQKQFVSNINLPDSSENKENVQKDLVLARWDVVDLNGNVLAKKGDLIPSFLPKGVKLEICFLNGNETSSVIEFIIDSFSKNCIYMVNKIDSRDFAFKYNLNEVYPISNQVLDYLERFKITSSPTKITKIEENIYTKTIDIVELRKNVLKGKH